MADTPDSKKRCCSFCGRSEDDVTLLFPSADGKTYICDGCVDICSDFLDEHFKAPEEVEDVEEITYETLPRPMEIKAMLDEHVIGQDEAKLALSVAVYNHYKRIYTSSDNDVEVCVLCVVKVVYGTRFRKIEFLIVFIVRTAIFEVSSEIRGKTCLDVNYFGIRIKLFEKACHYLCGLPCFNKLTVDEFVSFLIGERSCSHKAFELFIAEELTLLYCDTVEMFPITDHLFLNIG